MMYNAKTRKQCKTQLASTEALTSSERHSKRGAESQTRLPAGVVIQRKTPALKRRRKRGEVLEQGPAACGTAIHDSFQHDACGESSSPQERGYNAPVTADNRKVAMGSSDPRPTSDQQGKNRSSLGPVERARDRGTDRPSVVIEAEDFSAGKKGKRKSLGDRVWKPGNRKQSVVGGDHSRVAIVDDTMSGGLNRKRKRRNLLAGIGTASPDMVNFAGPLTRGMAKTGTDRETAFDRMKKQTPSKVRGNEKIPTPAAEESVTMPGTNVPNSGSQLRSSNETAELCSELKDSKSAAFPETPHRDSSGLCHVPVQSKPKILNATNLCHSEKSVSEVHILKKSISCPQTTRSARITRGMKDRGLGAGVGGKDPAVLDEHRMPLDTIDEQVEQATMPLDTTDEQVGQATVPLNTIDEQVDRETVLPTSITTARMRLRNQKKVGEVKNAQERPRKRPKTKQDKSALDTGMQETDMIRSTDAVLNNCTAKDFDNLCASGSATFHSQASGTEFERNRESLMNSKSYLESDVSVSPEQVLTGLSCSGKDGGVAKPMSTRGVCKVDGQSRIELEKEPELHHLTSADSSQPIGGRRKKKNDGRKDTNSATVCLENKVYQGGRLERLMRKVKKNGDSGGLLKSSKGEIEKCRVGNILDGKALEPCSNGQQDDKLHHNIQVEASVPLVPGPSNENHADLGEQRNHRQCIEGESMNKAGTTDKGMKLRSVGLKDKNLVEETAKSQRIDRDHLALKMVQVENHTEEKNFETVVPSTRPLKSRRKGFQTISGEAGSVKRARRLRSSMGCTDSEMGPVLKDIGEIGKTKSEAGRQTRGRGDQKSSKIASNLSVLPLSASNESPEELTLRAAAHKKGFNRMKRTVEKTTFGDVQPSLQHVDGGSLVDDGDACKESELGESRIGVHVSRAKIVRRVPLSELCKRVKTRQVRSTSVVAEDNDSKEPPEEGQTINVKELSVDHGVTAAIVQSEEVVGRAGLLDDLVKVTVTAPQERVQRKSQCLEAQGGIKAGRVPLKRKKPWRRKDLGCRANYTIITRARDSNGRSASNVKGQNFLNAVEVNPMIHEQVEGGPSSRVDTEQLNVENVHVFKPKISAAGGGEGVLSTTEKLGVIFGLEDLDVQNERVEHGEVLSEVHNLPRNCTASSISACDAEKLKSSIDCNFLEHTCIASKIQKEIVESCQKHHVNESGDDLTDAVIITANAQVRTTSLDEMELERSLVPVAPGKEFSALLQVKDGEGGPSNLSSLLNHFEEKEKPYLQGESSSLQDEKLLTVRTENLYSDQLKQKDVHSVLPRLSDPTSNGPFAVQDARQVPQTGCCEPDMASGATDPGLHPEVSDSLSPTLAKVCAHDVNSVTTANESYPVTMLDKSDSITTVEASYPATIVDKLDAVCVVEGSDLVSPEDESDPTSIYISGAIPTVDQSNLNTTIDMPSLVPTVDQSNLNSTIDRPSLAPAVDIPDSNITVDLPQSVTTVDTIDSINTIATRSDCIATLPNLDSMPTLDKLDSVTCLVKPDSLTSVEGTCEPVAVFKLENAREALQPKFMACEICLVRKDVVVSTKGKGKVDYSLIGEEAVNTQQEQINAGVPEVPLEGCEAKDDKLAGGVGSKSLCKDSQEPPTYEVEGIASRLEDREKEKSSSPVPQREVTLKHSLQHRGKFSNEDGPEYLTSFQERKNSTVRTTEVLCHHAVNAKDNPSCNDCTRACSGLSILQKSQDHTDLHGNVTDSALLGQVAPDKPSKGQSTSEVDDSPMVTGVLLGAQQKGEVASTVNSEFVRSLAQVGGLVELLLPHCPPTVREPPAELANYMGLEQCDLSRCRLSLQEDIIVEGELPKEKLLSGLEMSQLYKVKSKNYSSPMSIEENRVERDEPSLKILDGQLEKRIELPTKATEVMIEAEEVHDEVKDLHAEVKEVHYEAKFPTEVKLAHSEGTDNYSEMDKMHPEEVAVHAEGVVVQAGAEEVQAVQAEAKIVDGGTLDEDVAAKLSHSDGANVHAETKEVRAGAKEMHVEPEVDSQANEPTVDKATITKEQCKEGFVEQEDLDVRLQLESCPSDNLVERYVSAAGNEPLLLSEEDINKPPSSEVQLDLQSGVVSELTSAESVTLDCEKHTELRKQVLGMDFPEQRDEQVRSESVAPQRSNADGVKASGISKKRKVRIGSESMKESELQLQKRVWDGHEGTSRDEDSTSRVYSKKKGFLLASTVIDTGGMRIRPRPLDPDQSIPIFIEGRDKDFYEFDGGSFYRWVKQQEEAKLKKLALDPVDGGSEGGVPSSTILVKRDPIFIPLFRKLPEDQQRQVRCSEHSSQSSFPSPEGYVRYTKFATRTHGHALGGSFSTIPSVYDMDDEDEEWLQQYNGSLKQSESDLVLSDDAFEQLIELFEREFYRICQSLHNSFPAVSDQCEKGTAFGHGVKKLDVESSQRGRSRKKIKKDDARIPKSRENLVEEPFLYLETGRRFPPRSTSEDCCICNGGENSDFNPVHRCQICSISVHRSCYGICETEGNEFGHHSVDPNWCCRKCEAVVGGSALPSISCAICCKSGGAMKATVDPSKWAHVACALYTNETFFVDPEAMEPIDGLLAVETRVKKQRERCGLCGAREGSCVRCSTRGCRAPFHISCGVTQGASFELRHTKQLVVGVRSFCPRHASFVPVENLDDNQCAPKGVDPTELLPTVSTESSETLEMGQVGPKNIGKTGDAMEDRITDGARWPVKDTDHTKQDQSESKRYSLLKKKHRGKRDTLTNADVHEFSKTLKRSGSLLNEKLQSTPHCLEETDLCLPPTAKEMLECGPISSVTSGSSIHPSLTFDNVDHMGKMTNAADEGAITVTSVAKEKKHLSEGKSMTQEVDTPSPVPESAPTEVVSLIEANSSESLPRIETLDTNLAPSQVVKAVYSFWQSKRVKVNGPILHELKQLQAARLQGIFNKVVQQSNEFLPVMGHESPARIPAQRRARSLNRDPVLLKISELKQQLEMLRAIAGNVVRREQLKREDQKLLYESAQQQLLLAREKAKSRHCHWCENTQNLLCCSSCTKAFCFRCFKHRRGYGVKGWIAASKLPQYVCNFCLGCIPQERWPQIAANLTPSTISEQRGTSVSRVTLVSGRLGNWNHGLQASADPNSGKQVAFVKEAQWKVDSPNNPYGSSSSSQEAAPVLSPGRGKVMCTGQAADGQAVYARFAVPSMIENDRAVNRAVIGRVSPLGLNQTVGKDNRVQLDHHCEANKKLKRRRVKASKKQVEMQANSVVRSTKRIKKLARSSSFVYGSEGETTVSENEKSCFDKRTVKLSDVRDKGAKSQCTNLTQVRAEGDTEKGRHPLKFGIRFSPSGKLIFRRHEAKE